jgi:23S rRNA maturation mini-RNase III
VHYLQSPDSAGDIASVLKERFGLTPQSHDLPYSWEFILGLMSLASPGYRDNPFQYSKHKRGCSMQLLFNTFIVHSRQNFISAEMGGGQLTGNVLTRYNILIANAGDEALVFTGQRLSQAHALRLNPRQWAFVGDTVYDLFTRTQILTNTDYPLPKMHNLSVQKVQSSAQAQMLCKIEPILTPMEQDILRRGRKLRTRSSHARNDPESMQSNGFGRPDRFSIFDRAGRAP